MTTTVLFNFLNNEGAVIKRMKTHLKNIHIGRAIKNEIRIQKVTVLDLHLIVKIDSKMLCVYGEGVTRNGEGLNTGMSTFIYGDVIGIYDTKFVIVRQDEAEVEEVYECAKRAHYYYESIVLDNQVFIESDLCKDVSFMENKRKEGVEAQMDNIQEKTEEENDKTKMTQQNNMHVEGVVVDEDKVIKRVTDIKQEVTRRHFIDDGVVYETVKEEINIEETEERQEKEMSTDLQETQGVFGENGQKVEQEVVQDINKEKELQENTEDERQDEVTVAQEELQESEDEVKVADERQDKLTVAQDINASHNDLTGKNIIKEDNLAVLDEVHKPLDGVEEEQQSGDVHLINEEIPTGGISDNIAEDNMTTDQHIPSSGADIQTAVKILDTDAKEASLQDKEDLEDIKSAIVSKKECIDDNIKETIDNVVTDITVDPKDSVKQKIDLADAVIDKEILSNAEKAVDEIISQKQKVNETGEKTVNPFVISKNEEDDVVKEDDKIEKSSVKTPKRKVVAAYPPLHRPTRKASLASSAPARMGPVNNKRVKRSSSATTPKRKK